MQQVWLASLLAQVLFQPASEIPGPVFQALLVTVFVTRFIAVCERVVDAAGEDSVQRPGAHVQQGIRVFLERTIDAAFEDELIREDRRRLRAI